MLRLFNHRFMNLSFDHAVLRRKMLRLYESADLKIARENLHPFFIFTD